MLTGRRRRRVVLLVLAVVVGAAVCLWVSARPPRDGAEWKRLLVAAVQGADRVAVDPVTFPGVPSMNAFELTGGDKVQGFLAQIQIEDCDDPGMCACDGDVVFRFHKGKRELAAVSHHHGSSLRWRDGRWPGDAPLTAESQAALPAWLAKEGYPALADDREVRLSEEAAAGIDDVLLNQ